jgi:hypothetical protein
MAEWSESSTHSAINGDEITFKLRLVNPRKYCYQYPPRGWTCVRAGLDVLTETTPVSVGSRTPVVSPVASLLTGLNRLCSCNASHKPRKSASRLFHAMCSID